MELSKDTIAALAFGTVCVGAAVVMHRNAKKKIEGLVSSIDANTEAVNRLLNTPAGQLLAEEGKVPFMGK